MSTSAAPPPPAKAKRSQFIEKLHELLENPLDASSLRWTSDGSGFEITSNEAQARHALSPQWDFRSLSSFIRQLSYYNFKRLSDRRRSSERKVSHGGYIVFTHPTGFFRRGDVSQLDGITRKTRQRPEKTRRGSAVSTGSADDDGSMQVRQSAAYQPYPQHAGPSFSHDPFGAYAGPVAPTVPQYHPPPLPSTATGSWEPYASPTWPHEQVPTQQRASYGFAPPAPGPAAQMYESYSPEPQHYVPRRTSLSDYKVGPSPREKAEELPGGSAATGFRHSASPFAPGAANTHHEQQGFPSPYETQPLAPPPALGETGAFEPHHYGPSTSSFRPNGLPVYHPRSSISDAAGAASPAGDHSSYFYASPSAQPAAAAQSHLSLYPRLHHPHPRHPNEVLPSPTYSSDGDPPPPPPPPASLPHTSQQRHFASTSSFPPPLQERRASYPYPGGTIPSYSLAPSASYSSSGGQHLSSDGSPYLSHVPHSQAQQPSPISATSAIPSPFSSLAAPSQPQQQPHALPQASEWAPPPSGPSEWAPPPPGPSAWGGGYVKDEYGERR
ncbi:hypothetical protein JCM10213_000456 [Rhodosporidiobolus nylandii]